MRTLYKKNYKGEILKWSIYTNNNNLEKHIYIQYGLFYGKQNTDIKPNIKGKNIGKINETTSEEQVLLEIKSLISKKKKEGYKDLEDLKFNFNKEIIEEDVYSFLINNLSIDTTDINNNLKPMKAQQYYRSKPNWLSPEGVLYKDRKYYYLLNPYVTKEKNAIIIKFPALIQPKINGIRCNIRLNSNNEVLILSKEGIKYNIPLLEEEFKRNKQYFFYNNRKIIFDGELYIYNEKLQTIASAVKSNNLNTPRLQFICFDLAIPDLSNIDRIKIMKDIIYSIKFNTCSIDYIKTYNVSKDSQVQEFTDKFIRQGFEGSILRDPSSVYSFGKRPMTMVKLKRTISNEYKIVDIISQEVNNNLGLFICVTKEGKRFEVTPHGTEDFKELILFQKHLYIGKLLTCVFYEYTEDGIPFHIINNLLRDYE